MVIRTAPLRGFFIFILFSLVGFLPVKEGFFFSFYYFIISLPANALVVTNTPYEHPSRT